MKYKIAIFDMDGTILDTLEDLADTTNYVLEKNQMPQRTLWEVRSYVGNGIHRLVEQAVPERTDAAMIEKIFGEFNDYYKDHCAIKTRPYDGIMDVIRKLRESGVHTAVVSNKADYAVKSLAKDYFNGLFDDAVGAQENVRKKPAPDSVNLVLEHFGIDRKEAVYIGDSEVDYDTAKNAEMDLIMVGWGFRDEEFLKSIGVQEILHEPTEILTCF